MRDIFKITWQVLQGMIGIILAMCVLVALWIVSVTSFFILMINIIF